jgi:hypothetical protein
MHRRGLLTGAAALAAYEQLRPAEALAASPPVLAEAFPQVTSALGFTGFKETASLRKHNPWESFSDSSFKGSDFDYWPADFTTLPAVSFVVPDDSHNMHDGTITRGDAWLRANMDAYVQWAKTNNSIFFLWFDEDDNSGGNIVPAIAVGAGIASGSTDAGAYNHYSLLRSIEDAFGLIRLGKAASATPIPVGVARPDHIVVAMMENHTFARIIGNAEAPYINSLVSQGRLFSKFTAVAHPSEPNYFAVYSGSTQNVKDDGTYSFSVPSLGGQLTYVFRNAEAAASVSRIRPPPNDYQRKLIDNKFTRLENDGK